MRSLMILTLVLMAAPVAWSGEPDPGRGARFYSAHCGRCHNYRAASEHGDREWSIVMSHMRVVAGLPGDQARDIEAFLRIGNNPPRPILPPVAAPAAGASSAEQGALPDGATLLREKACVGCHVVDGVGGVAGPSLDTVFDRRDAAWVRRQIADPRSSNPETVMPQLGLSPREIEAIVTYLRDRRADAR